VLARTLAQGPDLVGLDLYEAALDGTPADALELARKTVRSHQLSPLDLLRDPNLSLLTDSAQLEAALGNSL
jgi:hypothetical protein